MKGFSTIVIILLVALVVVIGGGIAAFLYITSNTNPLTQSNAYTPVTLDVKVPTPDSETAGFNVTQTATPSVSPIATPAPTPKTQQNSQIGQVDVSTILSTDRKTLGIFFKSSSNFSGINSISYSVTYTTDSGQQNVKGVVTIASETINTDSEGKKSIQKNITVGTCSSGTCTYDTNPRNFRVSITTN